MKYERLTERINNIDNYIRIKSDIPYANIAVIDRLADLEDKIENGTLIERPYKVGDMVYGISGILDRVINGCIKTILITEFTTKYTLEENGWLYLVDEVFFTKAAAQKRLEELKS